MSEWKTIRLGDHIDSNLGKMLDGQKNKGQLQPYLGNSNVRWGRFDLVDLAQMKFEPHEEDRYGIRGGDLIVCEGGEPGRCAIWKEEISNMKVQKALHRIRTKEALNNYYLLYWFMLAGRTGELEPYFTGTTIKHLTGKAVDALQLKIPPIAVQKAIAKVLKSLDDKIELNRRMNETLEAMARAIFQSWFVDFDPVRAKASGESADSICQRIRLTPELLALFPDSFEDSELGEIPKGWGVSPLGDLSSYLSRGVSPKYLEEGGVCVLNQKCIRDGKVSTARARRHDTSQRSISGRELVTGDILVNSTGTGTLGRVAQIMAIDEPTIVDSHVTVVRANPVACAPSYLSLTLMERQAEIEALGEGSTGQTELSRARLAALKILAPPVNLMNIFDVRVKAFREASSRNDMQNITLAVIRDSLLPQLLSGELPIDATVAKGVV